MSEHDRLAALVSYRVLVTALEPVFDDITQLAARIARPTQKVEQEAAA